MAAPTATRPRKLLASLVETLERTKATAGVVDGGATDFESCKQFALSVYARADRGDRARPPNAVPTRAHVEAFSAAGTFLTALEHFEHFGHAKTSDLAIRKRYAEWRAWDLATAAREDRGASSVDEESHGAKAAPTEGNRNHREENASFDAAARAATTTTMRAAFSANAVETSTAAETRFAVPTTPSPDAPPLDAPPHAELDAPSPSAPRSPRGPPARRRLRENEKKTQRSPPRSAPWRPDWGGGGPHAVGDSVLYSTAGGCVETEGEPSRRPRTNVNENENARSDGFALARVVAVDRSVHPPAYVVEVDGAERCTEAARLAPAPDPREARARSTSRESLEDTLARVTDDGDGSVGRGGVERDEGFATNASNDAAATESSEDRLTTTARTAEDAAPSISHASAFAEARELAMRAAECLDPSNGDARIATRCLRRALEALALAAE